MRFHKIENRRPGRPPRFWKQACFRLFITHLTRQARFAAHLQSALSTYHITSFVAHKDIQPAEDWSDEVLLALRTADALLALVHRDFLDSEWTGQEVGFALGRGTLVLAVKLGEEPPGFLRRVQALPGQGKSPRSLAREVFLLLARHKQTRRPMAEALARGFEGTDGPSEAEDNMTWLEEMDYWDSQLSARLRSAIQKNHILADAWGVHERVEELIRRRNESYIAPVMRRGA